MKQNLLEMLARGYLGSNMHLAQSGRYFLAQIRLIMAVMAAYSIVFESIPGIVITYLLQSSMRRNEE